jgi:predicted transcriptional regulator
MEKSLKQLGFSLDYDGVDFVVSETGKEWFFSDVEQLKKFLEVVRKERKERKHLHIVPDKTR